MKLARLSVFLALPLILCGCSKFESNAFKTLSASQAVILQARADYISGKIKNTTCTDALITNATTAHDAAVTALEVYQAEVIAGTNASAQENTVTEDIAGVVAFAADIKLIYTNPTGCKLP